VHGPGLRRRIDAQLLDQRRAQPLEHGQGPGWFTGRLVGGHEQAVRRLVEPVRAHRGLRRLRRARDVAGPEQGLGRGVAGGAELRAVLRPQIDDPVGLGDVGQRRALAEQDAGAPTGHRGESGLAPGQLGPALVEHQRGLVQVDPDGRWVAEAVSGRAAENDPGAERGAQAAHEGGDLARRAAGALAGPEHVDDAIGGHDTAAGCGEQGEQQAGLAAAHARVVRRATARHGKRPREPDGHDAASLTLGAAAPTGAALNCDLASSITRPRREGSGAAPVRERARRTSDGQRTTRPGAEPLRRAAPSADSLSRNGPTMSSGNGKTTVEFWSAPSSSRVCR
jgi:hypothetical protein